MIYEGLFQSSLREVSFNFEEISRTGGRKNAFHNFIGSGKVNGQDLGRAPVSFKLNIFITGKGKTRTEIQDSYFNDRDAMIWALEQSGSFQFKHPTRGIFNVMQSSPYTMSETIGRLNKVKFSVSLIVVDNKPQEEVDQTNELIEIVEFKLSSGGVTSIRKKEKKKDSFFTKVLKNLRNKIFKKTGLTTNTALAKLKILANYAKSAQAVLKNIDEIQGVMTAGMQALSGTGSYSEIFSKIQGLSFLNTSEGLGGIGEAMGGIFVSVEQSVSSANSRYYFFSSFFGYNDDFEDKQPLTSTSLPNEETRDNEESFRDYIQVLGLDYACNALADFDFKTQAEINEIEIQLEEQFERQLSYYIDDKEMYNLVQDQRIVMRLQLDQSSLITKHVITVNVVNSSLTNVCYSYYGNLEFIDQVQDLNNFSNPSNINGEIKIFVSGEI